MNTINREHFEAWLFSQPDERVFDFVQGQINEYPGCLICNFLRENTGLKHFGVSSNEDGWHSREINNDKKIRFENWLYALLNEVVGLPSIFTVKQVKAIYLNQFPNAIVGNTPPEATVSKVESDSIAHATESSVTTS